jgi:hypothetical protein
MFQERRVLNEKVSSKFIVKEKEALSKNERCHRNCCACDFNALLIMACTTLPTTSSILTPSMEQCSP